MRCFFIFTILLFFFFSLAAQKNKKNDDDYIFQKVETESGTDMKAWTAYLKKAVKLPDSVAAAIPAGVYKVNVQFVIDTYGNITEVKAKNNPGHGLTKKAENIILSYEGVWRPANQCGRNVKSYKEQVVEFVIGN